jgi:hypothetical protein
MRARHGGRILSRCLLSLKWFIFWAWTAAGRREAANAQPNDQAKEQANKQAHYPSERPDQTTKSKRDDHGSNAGVNPF